MKFGSIPVAEAEGAILAHSVIGASGLFKKGRVLSPADIEALTAAGIANVVAARLEADDVPENEAARLLAQRLAGAGLVAQEPFTGRANIYANADGLLTFDADRITAFNRVHESITLATMPGFQRLAPKQMAATVKIIPFAVKRAVLEAALSIAGKDDMLQLAPFRSQRLGLVLTELPGGKASLIDKAEAAMRDRVEALGSTLTAVLRCPHNAEAVRASIAELRAKGCDAILLFGASAIVDRGDVLPAAVDASGGRVIHLGMPVDPGNLLMLAELSGTSVIGVPSCARSPKVNGFDWVLERILAGLPMGREELASMGAGGLLGEITSRPSPREGRATPQRAPRVAAIVLAAGKSSRMGSNKLMAEAGGAPLLAHVLGTLKRSAVDDIIVVTGHEAEAVKALLPEGQRSVHNPRYAEGLSTSVAAGLRDIGQADAALVCLGDMPLVDAQTINKLIAAFNPTEHRSICLPTFEGKRGNPVLWGRRHFAALSAITGDQGGRAIVEDLAEEVVDVPVTSDGVLRDADTPEALAEIRSALNP